MYTATRISLVVFVLFAIFLSYGNTAPSKIVNKSSLVLDSTIDVTTFYDANNILMFTSNNGSIGLDQNMLFDKYEGFYYPFSGDTGEIRSGIEDRTVMYAAGLILAGKVNGEIRTASGIYDQTEFIPGPMNDSALPGPSFFKTFKIDTNSTIGDYDYDNWPIAYGAPEDEGGLPLLIGEQTLWSVFNDADTSKHHNVFGGGTAPLGIEIRQTVWGSGSDNGENYLYLKYKLYNRGENNIDSFYIAFWADPDIGGPNDDLVGCDTAHDLFYCYNATDYDIYYEDVPPAWGGKVISGPVVPSQGDTAQFDGREMPGFKNIGMTSFINYINAEAPISPEELFMCARGWDCQEMKPLINPLTGDTTTYFASGNPLNNNGWVDTSPADNRLMIGFGPLSFYPGDSQQVIIKLGAYAEQDRLISLSVLRHILDENIPIDSVVDTTDYIAADSAQVQVTDFGLERVRFHPSKDRWLIGYNWGGHYYNGGVDFAEEFFGSGLDPVNHPDSFCYLQIQFSNVITQKAYRYVRGADPPYAYFGYYDVPFTAWDIDRNRQVNVAFVEHTGSSVFDSTWGPDTEVNKGGYEFLFIFNSDYSGEDPYNSAIPYPDYNIIEDIDSMDVLYFAWLALENGLSMDKLKEGDRLDFIGQFINQNGFKDSLTFRQVNPGEISSQSIIITSFAPGPSIFKIATSDADAFQPSTELVKFQNYSEVKIGIDFTPYRDGFYDEYLYLTDSVSGELHKSIRLTGGTWVSTDVTNRPELLPSEFRLYQNYPNPFNPSTIIRYSLPMRAMVNISVYNLLGQKVKRLVNETRTSGNHSVVWDGTNSSGSPVAAGIYFYRLKADEFVGTKKMLLVK